MIYVNHLAGKSWIWDQIQAFLRPKSMLTNSVITSKPFSDFINVVQACKTGEKYADTACVASTSFKENSVTEMPSAVTVMETCFDLIYC